MYRFVVPFLLFVVACGGSVEPDPQTESEPSPTVQAILVVDAGSDACQPAPVTYSCRTGEDGTTFWSLTEHCRTTEYRCDQRPSPHCGECR